MAEALEVEPDDANQVAVAVLKEIGRALEDTPAEELYATLPLSLRKRVERRTTT